MSASAELLPADAADAADRPRRGIEQAGETATLAASSLPASPVGSAAPSLVDFFSGLGEVAGGYRARRDFGGNLEALGVMKHWGAGQQHTR